MKLNASETIDQIKKLINPALGRPIEIEAPVTGSAEMSEAKAQSMSVSAPDFHDLPRFHNHVMVVETLEQRKETLASVPTLVNVPEEELLESDLFLNLPMLTDDATLITVVQEPLYSEEVFEKLSEMPRILEIDIETIPTFFYEQGDINFKNIDRIKAEAFSKPTKDFEVMLKNIDMANVNQALAELMQIEGAMAVAVVDSKSGMALGSAGGGLNLDVAAAGNSEVVKSKMKVMSSLGLKDRIEDILITLGTQYHLIRPTANSSHIFIYLVLNRAQSNLAMARHKLTTIESDMQI